MKIFIKYTLFWFFLCFLSFQCNDDTSLINGEVNPCHPEKEIVKIARHEQGIVANYHSSHDTLWTILAHVGEDNVIYYDSRDVGVVCHLPDSLKTLGLKVVFSGKLWEVDGELKPRIPGHTIYYLSITDIKITNENESNP